MKKWAHQEIMIGVILIIFSFLILMLSLDIRGEAAVFPIGLSIILIILSVFIVIRGLKIKKLVEEARDMQEDEEVILGWKFLQSPLTSAFLILTYILLITFIGFYPATVVFLIAYFMYMGIKGFMKYVLVIVSFTVFIYVLFSTQLRVFLPTGVLGSF